MDLVRSRVLIVSIEDRKEFIEYLIQFTNKTQEYWDKRTDREVLVEYQKLIWLD